MGLPVITPRNFSQKFSEDTRGGLYSVIGTGATTEAALSTGSLLNYTVPANKKTKVTGSLVATAMGTNTAIRVNVFDNTAGRIIPVATVTAANTPVFFNFTLASSVFTVTLNGDNAANDGAAACIVSLEELPT